MRTVWRFGQSARTAAVILAALVFAGVTLGDAAAASRACRQLEAQLASASGGGGRNSAQVGKYDKAIERQRRQMSIARSQARDTGCGFGIFGRKVRQCASLNATINKMEGNLDALQRKRGQLAGGSSGGKSRSRILASLDANGCRAAEEEVAIRRPQEDLGKKRRGLLEQLLGHRNDPIEPQAPESAERNVIAVARERGGDGRRIKRVINQDGETGVAALQDSYNTSCVRTCDGYFFPMSPSSKTSDFSRDQKNCESSCPGAEMQVFYRDPAATDETEMMSAATGRPYSELSTAFLYKDASSQRPATCGCNIPKNFEVIAGTPPAAAEQSTEGQADTQPPAIDTTAVSSSPSIAVLAPAAPPIEMLRPTLPAARTENDRAIDRSAADVVDRANKAEDRKVRVVGPVFLPDPGAAIDLRAPAQMQVQ